jgi:hypothetical protein
MKNLIDGYLWAFKNYEAGSKSIQCLNRIYSDSTVFVNVDYDGDYENYEKVCNTTNSKISKNNFQLGYCGNFTGKDVGYDCWDREKTFEWIRGIYDACLKSNAKYFILLEEDDFVLKNLSILDDDFSMAIHPTDPSPTGRYRANNIPNEFLIFISDNGGNPVSPGYGAGGGTVFNRIQFIKSWEISKNIIWKNYDNLKSVSKIIGWADYILQLIMQMGGYEIIQNNKLCEHWEVGDKWNEFEIVTGMKDMNIIEKI